MQCSHKFRVDTFRQAIPDGAEYQECTCLKCGKKFTDLEHRATTLEEANMRLREIHSQWTEWFNGPLSSPSTPPPRSDNGNE